LCASRDWREAASHPALWRDLMLLDFGLDAAAADASAAQDPSAQDPSAAASVGADGLPCDGPRAAYRSWHCYRAGLGLFPLDRASLASPALAAAAAGIDAVKVPLAAARLRALRMWASLDSFFARELPGVAASLRRPVSPADWEV
jgi:hypothetical protein